MLESAHMSAMEKEKQVDELLARSVDTIYPSKEALRERLNSDKKITIYLGIDPTSPHLHVGHAASLWTLRRFQDLGHKVILLLGDFTARIGDPTDKMAARQPLTKAEVKKNLVKFKEQAGKVIRFSGLNAAKLAFNSKWHDRMSFEELIGLAQQFTVQQMIERDMFQERIKSEKPIGLHEFLYPLMQGYDSVAMDVDAEVGGTDQTFNMLAGRTLLKSLKNKDKFVITNKLLVDPLTGKKLSKTEGSLINLDDEPNDMFGKVMAIPDGMILPLAELSTAMPMEAIDGLKRLANPRDAKLIAAYEVVKAYHSEKEAEVARDKYVATFSKKEFPEDAPVVSVGSEPTLAEIVRAAGVAESNSESWRLIKQGAVRIESEVRDDPNEKIRIKGGEKLQIGKKNFFRLKI